MAETGADFVDLKGLTELERQKRTRKRQTWMFFQLVKTPMPQYWAVMYGADAEAIERHIEFDNTRRWERLSQIWNDRRRRAFCEFVACGYPE